jgi:hypothetical protein
MPAIARKAQAESIIRTDGVVVRQFVDFGGTLVSQYRFQGRAQKIILTSWFDEVGNVDERPDCGADFPALQVLQSQKDSNVGVILVRLEGINPGFIQAGSLLLRGKDSVSDDCGDIEVALIPFYESTLGERVDCCIPVVVGEEIFKPFEPQRKRGGSDETESFTVLAGERQRRRVAVSILPYIP